MSDSRWSELGLRRYDLGDDASPRFRIVEETKRGPVYLQLERVYGVTTDDYRGHGTELLVCRITDGLGSIPLDSALVIETTSTFEDVRSAAAEHVKSAAWFAPRDVLVSPAWLTTRTEREFRTWLLDGIAEQFQFGSLSLRSAGSSDQMKAEPEAAREVAPEWTRLEFQHLSADFQKLFGDAVARARSKAINVLGEAALVGALYREDEPAENVLGNPVLCRYTCFAAYPMRLGDRAGMLRVAFNWDDVDSSPPITDGPQPAVWPTLTLFVPGPVDADVAWQAMVLGEGRLLLVDDPPPLVDHATIDPSPF